jgi:long-chain fatty acid transport protein
MNKIIRIAKIAAVIGAAGLGAAQCVFGLGFKNPDQDARATGQGEAFVAQADDAGAIYYNPGGLTQLKGSHVTAGGLVTFRNIRFAGPFYGDNLNDPAYLAHLYFASDFGLEKWRFGLGVNTPYGNDVDWGTSSPFALAISKASLMVLNIQPTVAYQLNEHVSLGVGLNVYYGNTKTRFNYTPLIPGSEFAFNGDGAAVGGTLGVLWTINEHNSVGAVYRSPFSINFDGTASASPGITGPSPANARIEFPQSVAVGYAFRPKKQWKLEVDVEWTNWDTLNTVTLSSADPVIAFDPRATIPFHWKDSFFYEFGTQYDLNENWSLRAGHIFSENTVPDSTFTPQLPDSDRHIFSVGAGYSTQRVGVDVVYQYSLSEDRTVSGSPANLSDGNWKSDAHALMITSTFKF